MTDPTLDLAAGVLGDSPSITVPIDELARRFDAVDADALADRLAADPRFLVLEPVAFPDLAGLPADRRDAYHRALRLAGLRGGRQVALVRRAALPAGADIAALLIHTAARLLAPAAGADPADPPGADLVAVAIAADRAGRALTLALAGGAGGPSTTRPPGP